MKLKSFHLLIVALIASVAISAFATDPVSSPVTSPIVLSRSNSFVPASFSADGNPMLSFTSFDRTEGSADVQVLDASIESVESFTIPADPAQLRVNRGGYKMQYMHWDKIERDTLDITYIWEYLHDLDYYKLMDGLVDNTSKISIYGNSETSFEVLPTGEKVIKHFIINSEEDFIEVTCSGSCTPEITFVVEEERSEFVNSPLALMSLFDYDNGTSTLGRIAVTQTLFNNDPDFEYVSPLYEEGDYYPPFDELNKWSEDWYCFYDYGSYFAFPAGGWEQYKEPRCIGFSIRNQSGSELQSVRFEDGFAPQDENFLSLILIGEKKYLSCNLMKDQTLYTLLYEIKNGENSVRQVGAFKTGVHPTLVSRGQNVMVDLENPDNDQVSVSVTDVTGKVLYNRSLNSGVESLAIPSESMSDGMNIVTVYNNNQPKSSTKVMVR